MIFKINQSQKLKNGFLRLAAVFVFFFLITTVYTWPLLLNFSKGIFGIWGGKYGGDIFSSVYSYWLGKYLVNNNLSFFHNPLAAYPFGVNGIYVFGLRTMGEMSFSFILTSLVNEIFAYNFFIFFSFILAGIITYLLAYYLLKDFWVSLVAGVIFSFSPYHLYVSLGWAELSQIYWIPLYFICLLKTEETKKYIWGFACGLILFLTSASVLYYGYFLIMISGIYFCFKLISSLRAKTGFDKGLKALTLGLFIGGLLTFLLFYNLASDNTLLEGGYDRYELRDLILRSSRPGDFIVPSVDHPIFGKLSSKIFDFFYPTLSHNIFDIFIGYLPLFLSIYGIKCFLLSRKKLKSFERFSLNFLILAAVGSFILSLPPSIKIGRLSIPSISRLIYYLAPMFKSVSRYGVVLICAISILAAYGLQNVLAGRKGIKRYLLILGCFLVIILEFQNKNMYGAVEIYKTPEVYEWLSQQPEQLAIAEYPAQFSDLDFRNMYYKFFQRIHRHPMMNGAPSTTTEDTVRISVSNLEAPGTPQMLSSFGIKYLVVHEDFYKYGDIYYPLPGEKINGLNLIKRFADSRVYEIVAEKQKVVILLHNHFTPTQDNAGKWWYLLQGSSYINFYNTTDKDIQIEVKFLVQSLNKIQELSIIFWENTIFKKNFFLNQTDSVVIKELLKPGSNLLRFKAEGDPVKIKIQDKDLDMNLAIGEMVINLHE